MAYLDLFRNYVTPEPGLNSVAMQEIEWVMDQHEFLSGFITLDEMKSSIKRLDRAALSTNT